MISTTSELVVGGWHADRSSGALTSAAGTQRVEPKVLDLLFVLAAEQGRVVSRERLLEALWPGMVVGDDALARTVSKLRQALGDDAKAPTYVETIAKRGYRLVAEVEAAPAAAQPASRVEPAEREPIEPARADREQAQQQRAAPGDALASSPAPALAHGVRRRAVAAAGIAVAAALIAIAISTRPAQIADAPATPAAAGVAPALVARADDFYFQFSRADNESAIALYERVLGLDPDDPAALAGLANALTQRSVRWPEAQGQPPRTYTRLGDALAAGHLDREPARLQLERARRLAERAVERAPASSAAHKALGFVSSARREFDAALASYEQAIALDPDAWGAMINVGDVLEIAGRADEALPWFERAYDAMTRAYERNPAQVRPWHAALGVLIAAKYRGRGDATAAEGWYRRVLVQSPLHVEATRGLAALLREAGDAAGADRLCGELAERLAQDDVCAAAAPQRAAH